MDNKKSTPDIKEPQESFSGIQSWRPYESAPPCCEPNLHIHAKDLSISYGHRVALQQVNLAINQGCITALVGPSGCGKTSFLMSMNRLTDLIPGCQVSGRLELQETNILASSTNLLHLRRKIGMIFQKPAVFPFSINRNLEIPLREHGWKDKATLAFRIETALSQVGLWNEVKDRLDHPAQALSGGQQQRLCLARALVLSPEILLLDEPCSALDPISSGIVEDLIMDLRGQLTIVIVTHNLAQARRMADHIALFWSVDGIGQLIENGPAQTIFETPEHELTAAYISGSRG